MGTENDDGQRRELSSSSSWVCHLTPQYSDQRRTDTTTITSLVLGRQDLATCWWKGCQKCRAHLPGTMSVCQRICRPLRRNVAWLSRRLLQLSNHSVMVHPECKYPELVFVSQRKKRQIGDRRVFDVAIGRDPIDPWMRFEIVLQLTHNSEHCENASGGLEETHALGTPKESLKIPQSIRRKSSNTPILGNTRTDVLKPIEAQDKPQASPIKKISVTPNTDRNKKRQSLPGTGDDSLQSPKRRLFVTERIYKSSAPSALTPPRLQNEMKIQCRKLALSKPKGLGCKFSWPARKLPCVSPSASRRKERSMASTGTAMVANRKRSPTTPPRCLWPKIRKISKSKAVAECSTRSTDQPAIQTNGSSTITDTLSSPGATWKKPTPRAMQPTTQPRKSDCNPDDNELFVEQAHGSTTSDLLPDDPSSSPDVPGKLLTATQPPNVGSTTTCSYLSLPLPQHTHGTQEETETTIVQDETQLNIGAARVLCANLTLQQWKDLQQQTQKHPKASFRKAMIDLVVQQNRHRRTGPLWLPAILEGTTISLDPPPTARHL